MIRSFATTAFLIVSFAFLTEGLAGAEEFSEVSNKVYWLCKHRSDVRTIRVHIDDHDMCSTFYSRDGSEKRVGSGKTHESCVNILSNIKTNLEKSSFTCRDISDTKITADMD